VTTVVAKLFHAVKPRVAVFGEKDYQQLQVIRRMVRDLNMEIEVVGRPSVREPDGLAMSSRNTYLSAAERESAGSLYQTLLLAQGLAREGRVQAEEILIKVREKILGYPHTRIDYAELVDPETLEPVAKIKGRARLILAVWVGKTRLIDNMQMEETSHL
jgi:pantoate--beta-alanine ligase